MVNSVIVLLLPYSCWNMIPWLVNLHGIWFSLSLLNPETSRHFFVTFLEAQVSEIIAKYDFPSYLMEFSMETTKILVATHHFSIKMYRSLTRCLVHLSLSEEIDRSSAIWVGFVVQMIFTIFHLLDAWLGFWVFPKIGIPGYPKMDGF